MAITDSDQPGEWHPSPNLYNRDLAPTAFGDRSWGWFSIFNVWSNAAQSLLGYTLAASLFISYGLNGWAVFAAMLLAGVVILILVNLAGRPSVRYGIPYPVMARAGMGVFGARFVAMLRGVVAIFWYGAQTYVASTAVAVAIVSLIGAGPQGTWLGLDGVSWISLVFVSLFQVALFWHGIASIRAFLNLAAPAVYGVMLVLLLILWMRAGSDLLIEVGGIFEGAGSDRHGPVAAFFAVMGAMIALYAPLIVNYGDFARYVRTEAEMKTGNLLGLMINIPLFALVALFVTAGTKVVFDIGTTDPTQIVRHVDNPILTLVAALIFLIATVGINVVGNFVPPANDLSNLFPSRVSFRTGGLIAAAAAFVISALWMSVISQMGLVRFVNTLGALLAPAYGILIADYYLVRKQKLKLEEMYSVRGDYFYNRGWNIRAITAFVIAAIFSVLAVWMPALQFLSGFDWIIGALLAGSLYRLMEPALH